MVTLKLPRPLHRLVDCLLQIGSAIHDSVIERQSRARPRHFLRLRRQAANEATSATPIIDEPVIDDEPVTYYGPVNDVDPVIGNRPTGYWPLRPSPSHWVILDQPPLYSAAPKGASPASTVRVDDELSAVERNSIGHQDGDNGAAEEPGQADERTKRDKVD
jgi:hypothetical protein